MPLELPNSGNIQLIPILLQLKQQLQMQRQLLHMISIISP